MSRSEQIASAEHELRGAATALALVCEALRRDPAASHHATVIDAQLDRLRAGLADLAAARRGRRSETEREEVELLALTSAAAGAWDDTAVEWEGGRHHAARPPPFRPGARQSARQRGRARGRTGAGGRPSP